METPRVDPSDMLIQLHLRLSGKPARLATDVIARGTTSTRHTGDQMLQAFDAKLSRRHHGIGHLLKNLLLVPQNPFDLQRRRPPRREAVTVGVLILLLIAAVIIFNVKAMEEL